MPRETPDLFAITRPDGMDERLAELLCNAVGQTFLSTVRRLGIYEPDVATYDELTEREKDLFRDLVRQLLLHRHVWVR